MRLAEAAKLDPRRADVQKLLALTTTELGALDDAAAAWEHYLKLQPNDDAARRERGYTAVKMGKFEQGTPTMFICGNNPDAKQAVSGLIVQFGWEPYDCGDITASRALEPLCMLWCLPGFQRNEWNHAFKMLTK